MADNDTTILDEADQFDDWVELYNSGERLAHLRGLFLSDDSTNPAKWPLPDVTLAPGDHLLVWCDDDTEPGRFHTPFKLDNDGEEIGIYDYNVRGNGVIDRVIFGALDGDRAYGRSPDGSSTLRLLPFATPGESNP